MYFKKLIKDKQVIEDSFGKALEWELLPDNKMSRIKTEEQGLSIFNENDWEKMNTFFVKNIPIFEKSFQPYIKNLR